MPVKWYKMQIRQWSGNKKKCIQYILKALSIRQIEQKMTLFVQRVAARNFSRQKNTDKKMDITSKQKSFKKIQEEKEYLIGGWMINVMNTGEYSVWNGSCQGQGPNDSNDL